MNYLCFALWQHNKLVVVSQCFFVLLFGPVLVSRRNRSTENHKADLKKHKCLKGQFSKGFHGCHPYLMFLSHTLTFSPSVLLMRTGGDIVSQGFHLWHLRWALLVIQDCSSVMPLGRCDNIQRRQSFLFYSECVPLSHGGRRQCHAEVRAFDSQPAGLWV